MAYAENTSVSVERSRAEIESILHRYGCEAFSYAYTADKALIQFAAQKRVIRFVLPLPSKDEFKTRKVRSWRETCTTEQQAALWEQACRQKWRALCLAIKAKLEAVTTGISLFEDEFLAQIVDPVSGKTVGELMKPELNLRYEGKSSAQLMLPGPTAAGDAH